MKNIFLSIITILFFFFQGCSNSFLDTENLTNKVDVNFYKTPADVNAALAGAYSILPSVSTSTSFFLAAELMSDDRFGGGGENDQTFHAIAQFKMNSQDMYLDAWTKYYQGVHRTNLLINFFGNVTWDNSVQRASAKAEAYFLRAYFYFDLARMFGSVPLVTTSEAINLPKASPDSIYGQIASDLKTAIDTFPATPYSTTATSNLGHATKWAAEGLMARVFLFYTGYYQKQTLPVLNGTAITKDQVIAWIDDCVANSGHKLIADFRDLWPYSYANKDYGYARNNKLQWIGEQGANTETVFAMKFGTLASWSSSIYYSNQYDLYFGWRNQTQIPFGQGWGGGPVNSQLWDAWPDNDIRKRGSMININDSVGEGITGYVWGADKAYHETGIWQKKYMPINIRYIGADGTTKIGNYSVPLYGVPDNYQLDNTQDVVLIRFSDILLMGAELGSTHAADYMHMVRNRVGLPDVPVTLSNIKTERRHELAFEGIRYYDLLRWHDVQAAMAAVTNVPVKNNLVPSTFSKNYRPQTGGFLPIPNSQILISNGVLKQNPGWDTPDAIMTGQ